MYTWRWIRLFALLLPLALAGCGQGAAEEQTLIHQLQAAGATVVQTSDRAEWPLSGEEQSIKVNGELVEIYAYQNAQQANADAAGISPDGQKVTVGSTTTTITLPDFSPHFYKKDVLIVYAGSSSSGGLAPQTASEVNTLLQSLLGPQIAGI